MGFEDMEVTLLDNPLEQMRALPLPPTLQAAAEAVCDKASIAQSLVTLTLTRTLTLTLTQRYP